MWARFKALVKNTNKLHLLHIAALLWIGYELHAIEKSVGYVYGLDGVIKVLDHINADLEGLVRTIALHQ